MRGCDGLGALLVMGVALLAALPAGAQEAGPSPATTVRGLVDAPSSQPAAPASGPGAASAPVVPARDAAAPPLRPADYDWLKRTVAEKPLPKAMDGERAYRVGRSLVIVGVALTVVSGVAFGIGGVLMRRPASFGHSFEENVEAYAGGLVLVFAGVAHAGAGLGLITAGAVKMSRAERPGRAGAAATPFVAPARGGMVAGLRVLTF
jgi:hypothetical protein